MVSHGRFLGHSEAWEHAEVLHRDLSPGNIMIDVESPKGSLSGFLTDWDMCKYKIDLVTNVPAMPGRSVSRAVLAVILLDSHLCVGNMALHVYIVLTIS